MVIEFISLLIHNPFIIAYAKITHIKLLEVAEEDTDLHEKRYPKCWESSRPHVQLLPPFKNSKYTKYPWTILSKKDKEKDLLYRLTW